MRQAITYADPGGATCYRLTVGTVNVLAYGKYETERRAAADWWQETTDRSLDDLPDNPDPELAQAIQVLNIAMHRAYMLAALETVEYSADGAAWTPAALPDVWLTINGFATLLPADLYLAWQRAARTCNPAVFWTDASTAGKGGGVVNVTTLTTP